MAKSWLHKVKVAGGLTIRYHMYTENVSIDRHTACNVAPVYLDTKVTVAKTIGLIREAASNRADLVVFPETHIPGYYGPIIKLIDPKYV